MLRRLRAAASCLSLVACVLFLILWVGSYHSRADLTGGLSINHNFFLSSYQGQLAITWRPGFERSNWQVKFEPTENIQERDLRFQKAYAGRIRIKTPPLFSFKAVQRSWSGTLPHWFLFLATGGIAVLLKPKPKLRFGLRELLAITTLLALALGTIEALARKPN